MLNLENYISESISTGRHHRNYTKYDEFFEGVEDATSVLMMNYLDSVGIKPFDYGGTLAIIAGLLDNACGYALAGRYLTIFNGDGDKAYTLGFNGYGKLSSIELFERSNYDLKRRQIQVTDKNFGEVLEWIDSATGVKESISTGRHRKKYAEFPTDTDAGLDIFVNALENTGLRDIGVVMIDEKPLAKKQKGYSLYKSLDRAFSILRIYNGSSKTFYRLHFNSKGAVESITRGTLDNRNVTMYFAMSVNSASLETIKQWIERSRVNESISTGKHRKSYESDELSSDDNFDRWLKKLTVAGYRDRYFLNLGYFDMPEENEMEVGDYTIKVSIGGTDYKIVFHKKHKADLNYICVRKMKNGKQYWDTVKYESAINDMNSCL